MSKCSDIIDGRFITNEHGGLIYTKVLGWIDLSHAKGEYILNLLGLSAQGELSLRKFHDVTYFQSRAGWGYE